MGIGTNVIPGPNTEVFAYGRAFIKNAFDTDVKAIMLDATAVDIAGNTPTTTLIAGTFLGLVDECGRYVPYDDDGTDDGRRVARGILLNDVNLLDQNATARNTPANMLVRGRVDVNEVTGADDNGWTDLASPANGCLIIKDSGFVDYSSSSSSQTTSSSSSSSSSS